MKKFLAICLTLAMLLGCMTFISVSAAEGVIMINNCDAYDGGQNDYMTGDKPTRLVDKEDKTEGEGCWSSVLKGDLAVGSFQRRTIVDPIDASAAKAFCFDLYVDDASKLNGIDIEIELCSTPEADVQEDSAVLKLDLKNGWNNITVPMDAFSAGKCDRTKITWIRLFNQTQVVAAGDGMLCKLDNLRFTTDAAPAAPEGDIVVPGGIIKKSIVVSTADDKAEWESGTIDEENKTEGASSMKYTYSTNIGHAALMPRLNLNKAGKAVDVTGANTFTFDIYVSDAATFNTIPWCLELTSAGIYDKEESAWMGKFKLVDGWNTVRMPMADLTNGLNYANFNYMRLFNTAALTAEKEGFFCLDNLRFEVFEETEAPAVEGVEEHIFRVFSQEGNKNELPYLYKEEANENASLRFTDGQAQVIYKFTVTNRYGVDKVTFIAKTGAQLLLQVSQDDATWTDVYKFEMDKSKGANQGLAAESREYDLTPYVDLAKCADIYVRIADAHPAFEEGDLDPNGNPGSVGAVHGWGGAVHTGADTGLIVEYTPLPAEELDAIEAASDENSVAVFGFNTKFGGMTIDKENKRAGSACANFDVHLGGVHQKKFDTPIDASGMDTLTFDLYVSDLALFDMFAGEGMNSGLELTSSGDADYQEVSWKLAGIRDRNIGDEIVVGWNHIILPLETADVNPGGDENNDRYGDFDISRIDFIRFFMVNEATDAGITLKIDNMRLDNSGIARAEAKAAADKAAADKVVERINKIGEVTLDSIRAIEKAEGEYAELTAEQQALVSNYDVLTAARAKYDELKAAEDNKPSGDENKPSDETTGEDEKPADENKPTDEKPVDEEGGSNVVIIIVVVAVVVVAAVVVVIILAKKKNKK